ncbi:hypothetical protein E1293_22940 [Actinomadura darangshiensis]|uniref:Uncharacterized protein n=1 Tax=Actinomadura darangshiensis TaxID=705336 RepID=A0A4R5B347_9ACTN|nr:hypothetical protein [Actinomadura darangshiensis]TDD79605.1 hypothetical protein E1293_22940 [Actinomadura darangshiensis]
MVLAGIPEKVVSKTGTIICQAFGGTGCGSPDGGGRPQAGDGDRPGGDDDGGGGGCKGNIFQKGFCHAKNGVSSAASGTGNFFKGAGLGVWDAGVGIFEGGAFVACLAHICSHDGFKSNWGGLKQLVTNPKDSLKAIWDDATKHCRKFTDDAEEAGRCTTNIIGSIVGGKGLNKLNKLKKLPGGKKTPDGPKVPNLADDAKRSADEAERLAREGKLDEAQKAADEARKKADEAERKAREQGCPVALGPPGLLLRHPSYGRTGAVAVAVCPAGQSAKQARREAGRAQKAVLGPRLKQLGLGQEQADALLKSIKDTDANSLDALQRTLQHADDPAKAPHIKTALDDLAALSKDDRITAPSLQGALAKLKNASGEKLDAEHRALPSLSAEVNRARQVADSGQVKPGTKVAIGAKGATDLGGGHKVTFPQGVDADVAYVDSKGVVHLNEVKDGMNAFLGTLKSDKQIPKYSQWARETGGQPKFVVNSGGKANELFRHPAEVQKLIDSKIPVEIDGKTYDSEALRRAQEQGHF